jgi:uncharacterized protein (DUF1800 family)
MSVHSETARNNPAADPASAWAPYRPDAEHPWTLRLAGHLYRRAAFVATWDQLQQALANGPERTIDHLLRPAGDVEGFNRTCDDFEISSISPDSTSTDALCHWWLRRMIQTPHPLLEKMTLFWQNHFATTNARAQGGREMQHYVQSLRSQALGRFSALAEVIARDPATVVALDLGPNPKSRPSDNLARAVLEWFTVGPGEYSDRDLREAARAFTGWSVSRRQLRHLPHLHDNGSKTVFGRTGNFSGDDVVRIALEKPATSRRLVRKLYRWLISEAEEPSDALLAPLATSFAKDYDVAKLVETMLRSKRFFSSAAYRQRIKSPVEFALGIVRPLEAMVPTAPLAGGLAVLGQDLCQPPTAKGWAGGQAWITTATLIARHNLAVALLCGAEPYGDKLDPLATVKKHGQDSADTAGKLLVDLFLQGDVGAEARGVFRASAKAGADDAATGASLRALVQQIATLPEFQLA